MCIVYVLRQDAIPTRLPYKMIIASNRDERADRPTLPLHFFESGQRAVLAGRDEEHGGTWLGVDSHGYIAAVTNSRELPRHTAGRGSRGNLVLEALTTVDRYSDLKSYVADRVSSSTSSHAPFNFLLIDAVKDSIQYFGTHDFEHPHGELISKSAFALSNGTIHSRWPKMDKGLAALQDAISKDLEGEEVLVESILRVLTDHKLAESSHDLPSQTCLTQKMEETLSSIFIPLFAFDPHDGDDGYCGGASTRQFGTVSSTVVLIDREAKLAKLYEFDWRREAPRRDEFILKYAEPIITHQIYISRDDEEETL